MRRPRHEAASPDAGLSRRERQIMRILYRKGEATVREVSDAMPDGPGYNAVRVTMGILERKGRLVHREEGRKYVYRPVVDAARASRGALRDVLKTFFARRPSEAILALLDEASTQLSADELDEIEEWIRRNREEPR